MNRPGLPALVRGVRAYFAAQSLDVSVALGWTRRSRQDNQAPGGAQRVVFIPGEFDPATGAPKAQRGGTIDLTGAQNHVTVDAGRRRNLALDHAVATVSLWAVDPARPQDEEGQIVATEALRELTFQAIHAAVDPETGMAVGFGNIESWGDWYWTLPPGEAAFGREITFQLVLRAPIFAPPISQAFATGAVARSPAT